MLHFDRIGNQFESISMFLDLLYGIVYDILKHSFLKKLKIIFWSHKWLIIANLTIFR